MNEKTEQEQDEAKPEPQSGAADETLLGEVDAAEKNYKEYIDFLNKYAQNDKLTHADIFHLYPGRIAYPDGYHDSRFFTLVGFNTKLMQKRVMNNKDGLHINKNAHIYLVRIFIDGSTLIRFNKPEIMDIFQCVEIGELS